MSQTQTKTQPQEPSTDPLAKLRDLAVAGASSMPRPHQESVVAMADAYARAILQQVRELRSKLEEAEAALADKTPKPVGSGRQPRRGNKDDK